jgi:hypothetical protein
VIREILPAATALFRVELPSFVPEDGRVPQWNGLYRDDPCQSAFGKAIQ